MTKSPDILGRQMLSAVKGYISRSLLAVSVRLDDFDKRLAAIPAGPVGPEGKRGEDGRPGDVGPIGPAGMDGKPGVDGLPGINGRDGLNGKDGNHGRDAIAIDPVLSLDMARSYQRGTWARYNGGMIWSARDTDPIRDGDISKAGWVVMWNGTSAVIVTRSDSSFRDFSIASLLTDGTRAIVNFTMPVVIHRGVYKASQEYDQADSVTHNGSTWICTANSTRAVPGKSDDWQLSVKCGSNGKDGAKGDKGDTGEPGMDLRFK